MSSNKCSAHNVGSRLWNHKGIRLMCCAGDTSSRPPPARRLLAGKYNLDKTRVWGTATLRKLQEGPGEAATRNRFADVALLWAVGLIEGAAGKGHGSELFRGQAVVMGRFLATVGTFCRCARLTEAAAPLCMAVLELLLVRCALLGLHNCLGHACRGCGGVLSSVAGHHIIAPACMQEPSVAKHPEPFVRTSALVATSELLRAIPPSTLAGAMLHSNSQSEGLIAGRLQQLQEALQEECEASRDDTMRHALSRGCLALQAQLADGAMASIEAGVAEMSLPSLGSVGRSSPNILLPPW